MFDTSVYGKLVEDDAIREKFERKFNSGEYVDSSYGLKNPDFKKYSAFKGELLWGFTTMKIYKSLHEIWIFFSFFNFPFQLLQAKLIFAFHKSNKQNSLYKHFG